VTPKHQPRPGDASSLHSAFPALVALVLLIPVLGYGYLWDDFLFLAAARSFGLGSLLPHPADPLGAFWRPLSREVYFAFLHGIGPGGPIVGHALNAAILILDIVLFTRLAIRMIGVCGGVVAGTLLASLAPIPFLAGWVSGIQDLMAMLFVLLALLLRASASHRGAFAASVCALLSKEAAAVFLPLIACLPWIQGVAQKPSFRDVLLYGGLGLAWAALHPGIKELVARGFGPSEMIYIGGVSPATAMEHVLRYSATLLNLPQFDFGAPWPYGRLWILALAILVAVIGIKRLVPSEATGSSSPGWPRRRVLAAAGYMALAPILLTAATIRGWQPYYAAFGGIGSSLLLGAVLSRRTSTTKAFVVGLFIALGFWQRSQALAPDSTTERNIEITSSALDKVEGGFRSLRSRFPQDSRIVMSVQTRGVPGVYIHLYNLQVMREWYHDPSIEVLRPEIRRTRVRPEFLFIVTQDLRVAELSPSTLRTVPENFDLDYSAGERAIRAYAMGWFASGDVDLAVALLTRMPDVDRGLSNAHRRMAAALLFASARAEEGNLLLKGLDPLPRPYALENMAVFLAERLPTQSIDEYVLRAFSIADRDTNAFLWLARWYERNGYPTRALAFAHRILVLDPTNREVLSMVGRLEEKARAVERYQGPREDGPLSPSR
jgi:hypothetical protein